MDKAITQQMKKQFEGLFPEYGIKLSSAKSQEQVAEIQNQFISHHTGKLHQALQKANSELVSSTKAISSDVDQTIPVSY